MLYNNCSQKHKLKLLLVAALFFCWLSGIVLAPVLHQSGFLPLKEIGNFLYFFYDPVCHQMPERSFTIAGLPMAVCVRCFWFYLGALSGAVLIMIKKRPFLNSISAHIYLIVPAGLDFLLEKLGIYSNLFLIRSFTGLLLGFSLSHLIIWSLCYEKHVRQQIR